MGHNANLPMTLTQLRYLVALADHLHFGRAAEACAISQPTLSAQLRKLEDQLQTRLIERGATIALSPTGEAVVSRARSMLAEADEIVSIAKRGEEPLVGPRRIGIIPTLCPYMLPWALPALKSVFPRLDLICREALTEELLAQVKARSLDWAIIAEAPNDSGLSGVALFEEPFLAALPCDHPLASAKVVPQNALAQERLLMLGEGHCLRDQTLAICGVPQRRGDDIRATSLETLRGLVGAGQGVTLLPMLARREGDSGLALLPISPPAGRVLHLVYRNADARRSEVDSFAEAVREALPHSLQNQ